jgi:hypothetical protein
VLESLSALFSISNHMAQLKPKVFYYKRAVPEPGLDLQSLLKAALSKHTTAGDRVEENWEDRSSSVCHPTPNQWRAFVRGDDLLHRRKQPIRSFRPKPRATSECECGPPGKTSNIIALISLGLKGIGTLAGVLMQQKALSLSHYPIAFAIGFVTMGAAIPALVIL